MPRHRIALDESIIEEMCKAGCTALSICRALSISPVTLYNWSRREKQLEWEAYKRQFLAIGDDCLRQKQYELAMQGDKALLIWLGKNRLGQRDKQDLTTNGEKLSQVIYQVATEEQKKDIESLTSSADDI